MNILFVCTGNSCRSQMAEGFARAKGKDFWVVKSAGVAPKPIHTHAIAVMQEKGIDISHQDSTLLTPDLLHWADLIITLCGDAEEKCPFIPANKEKRHWALEDPALAVGAEQEIIAKFHSIRDDLEQRINSLYDELQFKKQNSITIDYDKTKNQTNPT